MTGPLTGIRVLTLAGMGPVPFASMLLADFGADVVRVDRPRSRAARSLAQTEGLAAEMDVVGRGVDAVALDLKSDEGRSAVLSLTEHADVFVEGFRPGVAERLRLGPREVLARNSRIVYARLTGYGQSGPRALDAGHDINFLAQSGALHLLSSADGIPHPPMNLLGDYAAGGALAAFGIVSAVLSARSGGTGQVVDAAMVDGIALLTAKIQGLRAAGIHSDVPGTNFLDGGAPFYGCYRCADGLYIAVGAIEADFYREFLSRLGVDTSGWPQQDDRAEWPRLRLLIADVVAARTQGEWVERYNGVEACVSPVLSVEDAAVDAHNAERGVYRQVGAVLHPNPAPRLSGTPAREPAPPVAARSTYSEVAARWSSRTESKDIT